MNLQTAMGGLVHMTRVQGAIGACPTLPIVVVMCVCVNVVIMLCLDMVSTA